MDRIAKSQLFETFDRVVVLNLARRRDRLERFYAGLGNWPFRPPQRFQAIDGKAVTAPPGWNHGAGAWGCLLSHRQVLESAVADGVRSLLVLEDDACPQKDFATKATDFLTNVPRDWEGLMFGAQHLAKPLPIAPGIERCTLANRAHAYAVRGRFMQVLSQFWRNNIVDHCDIVLASLMPHFSVYAPDPILIGQDGGHSDISGRLERPRFWTTDEPWNRRRHAAQLFIQPRVTPVSNVAVSP